MHPRIQLAAAGFMPSLTYQKILKHIYIYNITYHLIQSPNNYINTRIGDPKIEWIQWYPVFLEGYFIYFHEGGEIVSKQISVDQTNHNQFNQLPLRLPVPLLRSLSRALDGHECGHWQCWPW